MIVSIREFNDLVNMSASELKDWLGSEESVGAGWSKDDGSGETIGHERSVSFWWPSITKPLPLPRPP